MLNCHDKAEASGPREAAPKSVTKVPKLHTGTLYDRPCAIVDQAGFGDTDGKSDASILGDALIFIATEVPR